MGLFLCSTLGTIVVWDSVVQQHLLSGRTSDVAGPESSSGWEQELTDSPVSEIQEPGLVAEHS